MDFRNCPPTWCKTSNLLFHFQQCKNLKLHFLSKGNIVSCLFLCQKKTFVGFSPKINNYPLKSRKTGSWILKFNEKRKKLYLKHPRDLVFSFRSSSQISCQTLHSKINTFIKVSFILTLTVNKHVSKQKQTLIFFLGNTQT